MTVSSTWRRRATSPAGPQRDGFHDLTFIGAGASTSFVLLSLLRNLAGRCPATPLRIGVIERDPAPFSGVPYGSRAARVCLLITNLRDFLPDGERELFTAWLSERKDRAFDEFRAAGGPYSALWWSRHEAAIARDDFDDLFLPRYVFGDYLSERVGAAIEEAHTSGVATVEVIQDEVRSVEPTDGGYRLACRTGTLTTRRLVLATGSAPVQPRLQDGHPEAPPVLVDDPFDHMERALSRIREGLLQAPVGRPPVVLVIGANASTMDLLYQVNDALAAETTGCSFIVLSPRGQLPERMDRATPDSTFVPEHLRRLGASGTVAAVDIYAAALADIAAGRASARATADMLRPISQAVAQLLPRLDQDQAAQFAGRWGAELGRHQRRAGGEYCEVVDRLHAEGRLRLVAGSFLELRQMPGGAAVSYEDGGAVHELDQRVDVVVNCGGPARRLLDAHDFLPTRLLQTGLCTSTPFGAGIAVDSSLRAAPGLWVMGPLLAGNVLDGVPIWHMEHCGRISSYGSVLGPQLAEALVAATDDEISHKVAIA